MSKDLICIIELSAVEKAKLIKKIKEEHNLTDDPIFEDITFLRVVDLSLNDSKSHTQGKISEFLNSIFTNQKFNIPTIYRLLFDEVKRRTSYNREIMTYNDLVTNKSIGKSQFERIIKAAGINKDYTELWNRLEVLLQTNGINFQNLKNLQQAWKKLEIEKMDPNNDYLKKIINSVKILSNELEVSGAYKNLKLIEVVHDIYTKFSLSKKLPIGYDENFIKAIILSEIYE